MTPPLHHHCQKCLQDITAINLCHSQNRTLDSIAAVAARINSPVSVTSSPCWFDVWARLSYWPTPAMCPFSSCLGAGLSLITFIVASLTPCSTERKKVLTHTVKYDSDQHSSLRLPWVNWIYWNWPHLISVTVMSGSVRYKIWFKFNHRKR